MIECCGFPTVHFVFAVLFLIYWKLNGISGEYRVRNFVSVFFFFFKFLLLDRILRTSFCKTYFTHSLTDWDVLIIIVTVKCLSLTTIKFCHWNIFEVLGCGQRMGVFFPVVSGTTVFWGSWCVKIHLFGSGLFKCSLPVMDQTGTWRLDRQC